MSSLGLCDFICAREWPPDGVLGNWRSFRRLVWLGAKSRAFQDACGGLGCTAVLAQSQLWSVKRQPSASHTKVESLCMINYEYTVDM